MRRTAAADESTHRLGDRLHRSAIVVVLVVVALVVPILLLAHVDRQRGEA